jgi:opacity protein-like surface antigen
MGLLRRMRLLSILAPLLACEAMAQPADVSAAPEQDHWYSLYKGKKFGFQLDAGVPDGAGLMVLFRPWAFLRVNGGLAYNVMGAGIRGGLTATPFHWIATPTFSFDLGHYFSGDLTKFVTASNPAEQALLSDTPYNFWSAQIGFEVGSQEGFAFYLRGGLTYLSSTLSGQNVAGYMNSRAITGYYRAGDAHFSALLPSVTLGFVFFIF